MGKPCFKTICYEFNDVLKLTGTCLCYFTASCRFWISIAAMQLHFTIWPCRVLVKASICFLLVWSKWTFKEQRFNLNKNKENFKWYMLSNFFYFTRFIFKKKVCCPRNTIMGPSVNAIYFHSHYRVGLTAALNCQVWET